MSDEVTIEHATEVDVPEILVMIEGLAEYERMSDQVAATEESLRQSLFGDRPSAEVIFARVGGERVGFAVFFHNYSTFLGRRGLYLEDLFVKPEFRGRGYGRTLLAYLARLALERGCGRMEWAVLDWNAPAIEFYRNLGAAPLEGWTVYRLGKDRFSSVAGGDRSGGSGHQA
jgi:GNAT superfamily N-acetyltransferase